MASVLGEPDLADAAEADLRRYFATDIRDLYTGRLRVRQVCVYLRALPPESLLVLLAQEKERENDAGKFASAAELAVFIKDSGKAG